MRIELPSIGREGFTITKVLPLARVSERGKKNPLNHRILSGTIIPSGFRTALEGHIQLLSTQNTRTMAT